MSFYKALLLLSLFLITSSCVSKAPYEIKSPCVSAGNPYYKTPCAKKPLYHKYDIVMNKNLTDIFVVI